MRKVSPASRYTLSKSCIFPELVSPVNICVSIAAPPAPGGPLPGESGSRPELSAEARKS